MTCQLNVIFALLLFAIPIRTFALSIDDVVMDPAHPRKGQMLEFSLSIKAKYQNPFDPEQIDLSAAFITPGGTRMNIPGFYTQPYRSTLKPQSSLLSAVQKIKFYLSADAWPKGALVTFLLDEICLRNSKTGNVVQLHTTDDPSAWHASKAELAIDHTNKRREHPPLSMTIKIDEGWPGIVSTPRVLDWSAFDTLSFWVMPRTRIQGGCLTVEALTEAGNKFFGRFFVDGLTLVSDKWQEVKWRLPTALPAMEWQKAGSGQWRIRLTPAEAGSFRYKIRLRDSDGEVETPEARFTVSDSAAKGFVRIDRKGKRYLVFDTGEPCFPVGYNMVNRDVVEYDMHLRHMEKVEANFLRIWMAPKGFGIEVDQLSVYRQDKAAQFDYFLQKALKHGVYVMVCLIDFREAKSSTKGRSPGIWSQSPYAAENGGPCANAADFFHNRKAAEIFKKRLRYIVARWAGHTNVLAWEFWNEVDLTDAFKSDPTAVCRWHDEMADFLSSLDPYRHVITTSFAGPHEQDPIWNIPFIQLTQGHRYSADPTSFADIIADCCNELSRHKKSFMIGEFGRRRNQYAELDKEGVSLHNGIWAAMMSGSCAAAMPWWHNWIYTNDLFRHFDALSNFVRDIHWASERFRPPKTCEIEYKDRTALPNMPLVLAPAKRSWQPDDVNRPNEFNVSPEGEMDEPDMLASILHGLGGHRDLHNPQTFYLDYAAPGKFIITVDGVSGWGGAHLMVSLDGELKLDVPMEDNYEDHNTIADYNGQYAVDVPKGRHTVVVRNEGADWIKIGSYILPSCGPKQQLIPMALQGDNTMLVWLRNSAYAWFSPLYQIEPMPIEDASVCISEVVKGDYRAELFDTQQGAIIQTISIHAEGTIKIPLPPVQKDLAVTITPID